MAERSGKFTGAGWQLLAVSAAVSTACAAMLVLRWRRSATRDIVDPYEAWWQHRDEIRKNGEHSANLFV